MKQLLSELQICQAILPVDLASGAVDGDWVSLENYGSCVVVIIADPGTAAEDLTISLDQAQDNAATGAKALNFTTIYTKQAASNLLAVAQYTKVTQTADDEYTEATSGEQAEIWAVEVRDTDLDVANGFTHIRLSTADPGATAGKLAAAIYILGNPRYIEAPENLPSAIA